MSLSKIEIRTPGVSGSTDLIVGNPTSTTKYLVRSVEGLDPVKADINVTDYAGQDGATYNSARLPQRNLLITLDFLPDYAAGETVMSLRRALYVKAGTKKLVQLRLVFTGYDVGNGSDNSVYLTGYVESNENTIFAKDPSAIISIIAVDPYFYGTLASITSGATGASSYLSVFNGGDAPVGFTLDITPNTNISAIAIEVTPAGGSPVAMIANTGGDPLVNAGVALRYSSLPKQKSLRRTVSGFSLLRYINPMNWLTLPVGYSNVRVYDPASGGLVDGTAFNLTHIRQYEGL